MIVDGRVVTGRAGFGGECGHVLIPTQRIAGLEDVDPHCNCGRIGDLESVCSLTAIRNTLLPTFLQKYPGHELATLDAKDAAKKVRGLAERGDAMCRDIFRVQAHALGLFFDQMINTFDPDALIVGGGAIEASPDFQSWFLSEIRAGMPVQREEQSDIAVAHHAQWRHGRCPRRGDRSAAPRHASLRMCAQFGPRASLAATVLADPIVRPGPCSAPDS